MDQVIRLSITGRGADTDAPTVDDLFEQVRDYFVVMQEVERALAADGVNAIDWRVVSASTNSPVELGVAPFPREYAVNMDDRVDAKWWPRQAVVTCGGGERTIRFHVSIEW